ncbi:jouberin isoform X4 [Ascaphus truei]|uniref:jouberin isoform X4 n=1 Tax=Ascaphus truei TaxID=8439 RepID=UPI003F59DD6C
MPTMESEAKARTKARFDEVFQSYTALSDVKNKSKKKRNPQEELIVLETFKNQLDLTKESANETIINNTYNAEEESPRFKKNKLRERVPAAEKPSNISTKEHKQAISNKKKKKAALAELITADETQFDSSGHIQQLETKSVLNPDEQHQKNGKKKGKNASREDHDPTDFDDEDQLIEAYRLQVSQEETHEIKEKIKNKLRARLSEVSANNENQAIPLNNQLGIRKKKKKKVLSGFEPETSAMSLSELQDKPVEESNIQAQSQVSALGTTKESRDIVNKDDDFPKTKGKKAKKKTKNVVDDGTTTGVEDDNREVKSISRNVYDDSLVLGVYIHRSDKLKTDLMVSHPMVKIHTFDQKTGEYVKKENSNDTVSSFSEQEKTEHILPMMTQPYDFKRFKSPVPEWDEQIIFNERFPYFLEKNQDSPQVILFFEILDFFSADNTDTNSAVQIQEKGFPKIAWAFLKLVGANEVLNVDTKLRLQLYYPPSRARIALNSHIYEWWLKYPRNRYPSTLYVTIKGLKLPDNAAHSRTIMALQQELGSGILNRDLPNEAAQKGNESEEGKLKKELFRWTRLPGQACRIPNRHLFSLRAGHMGCFSVRFSNDGRTLAAACADRDGFPIYLYEIPSGKYLMELHGHLNVVYDLCWSETDQNLLTASSDGTVRLWKIENQASSALKVLPHPSFVYTAKFHPTADYLAVTGCYDAVIRVWDVKVKEINGQLLQEFDGHRSFINTICFDAEALFCQMGLKEILSQWDSKCFTITVRGLHMYSGDNSGMIIVWNALISGSSRQNPLQHWSIIKEIREIDMKGIPVSHLQVHPNGRRLLIHAKDSTLRIMDLRVQAAKKLIGATNYREKIHSAFTPCGTFIFAGSEDCVAYVWNAETGDQVAKYCDLSYTSPLRDVAFHPFEHMVAFCAFGQSQPLLVYIYDYKVAQMEAEAVHTSGNLCASEILTLQESSLSADGFINAAKSSMRMLKIKQKLDSVLTGSNLLLPGPSLLSPHSILRLPGTQSTQLITQPIITNQFGGFSPVGQSLNRTPSIRLQMNNSNAKISSLKIEADSLFPVQETWNKTEKAAVGWTIGR